MPRQMGMLAWMVVTVCGWAAPVEFTAPREGEVVAHLELSSPGSDWAQPGREAALATVLIDGQPQQHLMVVTGSASLKTSVFLGPLAEGRHKLEVQRHATYSAPGSPLQVGQVQVETVQPSSPLFEVLAHAPVLTARKDTIGKFTDVPLLQYAERLTENGQTVLQYTMIFSNEDGGTSTRALMARWGRTTDIEYIYKAVLDAAGNRRKATIQSRGHEEIEYRGEWLGNHPLLLPVTLNNMVAPEAPTAIRYQLMPVLVDLSRHSREQVMDEHPHLYQVMAKELIREAKLRPYGQVEGEKISDLRHYAFAEFKLANQAGAVALRLRLRGQPRWFGSDLGRLDYAIGRDGWVRTTVELPPGTKPGDVAEVAFHCLVMPDATKRLPADGRCKVEQLSKLFFLREDYLPQASFFENAQTWELGAGEMVAIPVDRRP